MIKISLVDSPEKREYARRIRHKVFVEEQKVPEELDLEGDESSLQFLAEKEGMYVCTGRYRVKGPFLKIERLATLPEARGKGVASALMLFMQALGYEEHPKHLQLLHAQLASELFYQRLGWVSIGPIFEDAGIEHRLMIRLPQSKESIPDLLCLKDPNCPSEISEYLKSCEID